ncbi:ATP-dependent helicase C-terminal domain-containing protein [Pararhodospirillum photometricum]|uniref:ATP-dependent helicase C-terminal domain-containing protein n=1 Tax=Pararhodospirillum photometricum TaxID=1084 RepID=UPI0002FCB2A6
MPASPLILPCGDRPPPRASPCPPRLRPAPSPKPATSCTAWAPSTIRVKPPRTPAPSPACPCRRASPTWSSPPPRPAPRRGRSPPCWPLSSKSATFLRARDPDLRPRLALALSRQPAPPTGRADALARVRDTARQIRRRVGLAELDKSPPLSPEAGGRLLALAYPDRVAQARPGAPGRFLLASGRGASLDPHEPLAHAPYLVVADLVEDTGTEGRIRLAAPLDRDDIDATLSPTAVETLTWDPRAEAVIARRERRLGALVLESQDLPTPGPRAVAVVLDALRRLGLACLPWTPETTSLRARVTFLATARPQDGWPDLGDSALLDTLETWLGPFLPGITRRSHFTRLPLADALKDHIGRQRLADLERLAPRTLVVPSGVPVPLDYTDADGPVLAARVQQLFGLTQTPTVAGRPVLIHLLSPAGRPLQVTRDLAGFWKTSYAAVRKDMRGRYPKHPWPEDPTLADATNRTKPRKA